MKLKFLCLLFVIPAYAQPDYNVQKERVRYRQFIQAMKLMEEEEQEEQQFNYQKLRINVPNSPHRLPTIPENSQEKIYYDRSKIYAYVHGQW